MAGNITLTQTFTDRDTGLPIAVTDVKLSDPTATYGVKRNDTDAVVVADGQAMTEESTGVWTYIFAQPADGLTYTYWVEWVSPDAETFRNERTVDGTAGAGFESTRDTTKYVNWVANEFLPLVLATPEATVTQQLENAIRYWNTHSGHKICRMYDYAEGEVRVQLDIDMKMPVRVLPSRSPDFLLRRTPAWSLLGIGAIGYGGYGGLPSDLIELDAAYREYEVYLGKDFRWTFQTSQDPMVGGFLYVRNLPTASSKIYVEGTKRITANEDIANEYINDWLLRYTLALVKIIEGNTLRKAGIIDVKNDGAELLREGKEDRDTLRESLAEDARWTAMVRRI